MILKHYTCDNGRPVPFPANKLTPMNDDADQENMADPIAESIIR